MATADWESDGPGATESRATVERASPNDLMELAADLHQAPMQVGAILVLDSALELDAVRGGIGDRIRGVPRLRQRLVRVAPGCGRPIWVDDPRFDITRHVHAVPCPAPGDEEALLAVAAETVTTRLPADAPLWSARLVTGLTGGRTALIVAFHHVLADGIGGLAVLAQLVDGGAAVPGRAFPGPAPSGRELFVDALTSRLRAVGHLPAGLRSLRGALAELKPMSATRAPLCSLNRPTGSRRSLGVARADLARVRGVAHAHGGTVNDAVLTAVAGALRGLLSHRGETVETVVISVPVSARRQTSAAQLGNAVGVIPVSVPVTGDAGRRLEVIAGIMQERKEAPRAASAALLGPLFRILARLGLLHRFIDHQRMVTTFVTNLRGPDSALSFLGAKVTHVVPVSGTTGNVTVAFGALSYAGTLTITVIADPDACPDLPVLVTALQGELDLLATAG